MQGPEIFIKIVNESSAEVFFFLPLSETKQNNHKNKNWSG